MEFLKESEMLPVCINASYAFKVTAVWMTLHSKKEQVGEVMAVPRNSVKFKGVQQCLPGTQVGINMSRSINACPWEWVPTRQQREGEIYWLQH